MLLKLIGFVILAVLSVVFYLSLRVKNKNLANDRQADSMSENLGDEIELDTEGIMTTSEPDLINFLKALEKTNVS